MVVYGLRYLLETYLLRQWTVDDVEKADKFYRLLITALTNVGSQAWTPSFWREGLLLGQFPWDEGIAM